MPSLKISSLPKPPMPKFMKNHENRAKGYSYVNLVIHVYQLYSFWFDVSDFGRTFLYALIYCAFVILPIGLGFFLLIGVHKRELQKVGIWWAMEIFLLCLYITLFIVGLYKITVKTMLNLILHGALRIFGLKVIYDFMVSISEENGGIASINKIAVIRREDSDLSPADGNHIDNAWSGEEKL